MGQTPYVPGARWLKVPGTRTSRLQTVPPLPQGGPNIFGPVGVKPFVVLVEPIVIADKFPKVTAAWPSCLTTPPNPTRIHWGILPTYPARPTNRTTIRVVQFRVSFSFSFSL